MVSVDLQEREHVIEDMRLALTEQEETQTELDLELDNREAQINELTQGTRSHEEYCIRNTLMYSKAFNSNILHYIYIYDKSIAGCFCLT